MKDNSALGQQLEQALIWERWPDIAGPSLYMHARPHSIRGTSLRVEAESSVWMNKLAFRRAEMLRRLQKVAPKSGVDDIYLLLIEDGEEVGEDMLNGRKKRTRRKQSE